MSDLIEGIASGLELLVRGLLDFLGLIGIGNEFVVVLILAILAFVLRLLPGAAGGIAFAIMAAITVYALVLAFGFSDWFGMVLGVGALCYGTAKLVKQSRANGSRAGLVAGAVLLVFAVVAEFSLLTAQMPSNQLERDTGKAGALIERFIRNLVGAANDGADNVNDE